MRLTVPEMESNGMFRTWPLASLLALLTSLIAAEGVRAQSGTQNHSYLERLPPPIARATEGTASAWHTNAPQRFDVESEWGGSWDSFEPAQPGNAWQAPRSPLAEAVDRRGVKPHKDGFFQKLSLQTTLLDGDRTLQTGAGVDKGGLTLGEIEFFGTFALPAPTAQQPLLITPGFNVRYLDAGRTDIPDELYDAYLQFLWLPQITDRWSAVVGAGPGWYSDFQTGSDDALRITGRGLARYQWVPGQAELLFGVLYLDRPDISLLPAGGLIWTPDEFTRHELLFPRPKLSWQFDGEGQLFEDWFYVAGEFGGDSWSIERPEGVPDRMTLRDFRASLGLERKFPGGSGYRLEVGYVFGRTIEFESGAADFEADSTVLVRAAVTL